MIQLKNYITLFRNYDKNYNVFINCQEEIMYYCVPENNTIILNGNLWDMLCLPYTPKMRKTLLQEIHKTFNLKHLQIVHNNAPTAYLTWYDEDDMYI